MARTGVARGSGAEIHFVVRGSGPLLLLIAGTGYAGQTWPGELVDSLGEDFSVVTFDHRGTGASPSRDGDYSTMLFAEDAAAVLDEIGGDAAIVIGHSMGGRVAQWLAHIRPDLVRALVLAASGPGERSDGHQGAGIPVATILRLVDDGYERFMRELQERTFFTDQFVSAHPDRVRWLGDAFWESRPDLEDYLKHVLARQSHNASEILSDIACPTLILVGSRDTHRGDTGSHVDQSRLLAELVPGADFVLLPGVTHGFFWQDPEHAMAVIRTWLAERLV